MCQPALGPGNTATNKEDLKKNSDPTVQPEKVTHIDNPSVDKEEAGGFLQV